MVAKNLGSMPSSQSNSSPAASKVRRLLLHARYKPLVRVERRKQKLREEQGLDLNTLPPRILLDFFQILDKLRPLPELGSGKACGFRRNSGLPF